MVAAAWFERIGPGDAQALATDVGPVPANVGAVLLLDRARTRRHRADTAPGTPGNGSGHVVGVAAPVRRGQLGQPGAIFLYAAFACLVTIQQGSLWLICGCHAGWNFFQGNVYGVPVSGNPEPTSLFAFGPTQGSRELLSGGAFGIEASLVATVLLILSIAVATVDLRRTSTRQAPAMA